MCDPTSISYWLIAILFDFFPQMCFDHEKLIKRLIDEHLMVGSVSLQPIAGNGKGNSSYKQNQILILTYIYGRHQKKKKVYCRHCLNHLNLLMSSLTTPRRNRGSKNSQIPGIAKKRGGETQKLKVQLFQQ